MEGTSAETQVCEVEERLQQTCLCSLSSDGVADVSPKVGDVVRDEVGQVRVLCMIPDLLSRIEVRCIGRKPLHADDPGVALQVFLQDFGSVWFRSVEYEDELAADVAPQRPQENHDLKAADILGVNLPVETESNAASGKGNGTDNRQAIMTVPCSQNRSLTPGRPRSTDYRLQHEAALVDEEDASTFLPGVFLYAAIAAGASGRFVPHHVLELAAQASGNSSPNGPEAARHEKDGR